LSSKLNLEGEGCAYDGIQMRQGGVLTRWGS
jgi:hypothetical protein